MLAHYWRDDDPVELTGAIGADWADVLEGIPAEYIQRACIEYQREEPRRKPTPGAVYQLARRLMPSPRVVPQAEEPEPRRKPASFEDRQRIAAEMGLPILSPEQLGAAKRIAPSTGEK